MYVSIVILRSLSSCQALSSCLAYAHILLFSHQKTVSGGTQESISKNHIMHSIS